MLCGFASSGGDGSLWGRLFFDHAAGFNLMRTMLCSPLTNPKLEIVQLQSERLKVPEGATNLVWIHTASVADCLYSVKITASVS